MKSTGPDWDGLGWAGLGWAGLGCAGLTPRTENAAIAGVASDSLDTLRNPNGVVGPADLDEIIASFAAGR